MPFVYAVPVSFTFIAVCFYLEAFAFAVGAIGAAVVILWKMWRGTLLDTPWEPGFDADILKRSADPWRMETAYLKRALEMENDPLTHTYPYIQAILSEEETEFLRGGAPPPQNSPFYEQKRDLIYRFFKCGSLEKCNVYRSQLNGIYAAENTERRRRLGLPPLDERQ